MSGSMIFIVFAVIFILFVFLMGGPIWVSLAGGAALLMIGFLGLPSTMVSLRFFGSLDSFTLMAVPFFLLAGNVMAYGGCAPYIFKLMNSCFGKIRGGIPIAAIATSAIYAAITGSTIATLMGVSSIALPVLDKAGYPRKFSCGLLACSATLGNLIPPSILMIIYGTLTSTGAGDLFISGIIPGVLCAAVLAVVAVIKCPPKSELVQFDASNFTAKAKGHALVTGLPALIMPIIVLGSIYAGIATPTEAGAISCIYGFIISIFVYRAMKMKEFKKTLHETASGLSMAFALSAASIVFAVPLTYLQIPQMVASWVAESGLSGTALVLLVAAVYLVMGCFLDPLPILFLVLPVVYPALVQAGVNMIYFNVVSILCMQIGQVTPPFGISLYLSAKVCNVEIPTVIKSSLPYIIAMIGFTLLCIFVPGISTCLVH